MKTTAREIIYCLLILAAYLYVSNADFHAEFDSPRPSVLHTSIFAGVR